LSRVSRPDLPISKDHSRKLGVAKDATRRVVLLGECVDFGEDATFEQTFSYSERLIITEEGHGHDKS
jgi:hypothetical protein